MKYCPNCGTACDDGALFCGECGNRFEAAGPVQQPAEEYYTAPSAAREQWQQPQYNETQYSQPQYNQPQYNETQYSQPQYNQQQYGQSQYNETQYSQPQYNQVPYGQNPYGQPQYDTSGDPYQNKQKRGNGKGNKLTVIILSAVIAVMLALIILTIILIVKQKSSDAESESSESQSSVESVIESEEEAASVEEAGAESEATAASEEGGTSADKSDTAAESESEEIVEPEAPAVPTEMTLLSGEPDLSNYTQVIVSGASASSTIVQTDTVTSNKPILLFDNDENTNWQEGVDGYGIGEYVICTLERDYRIKYIGFKMGNWKADPNHDYYGENAKPKTLEFDFGSFVDTVTFASSHTVQWVELDVPVETDFIQFTIRDIYTGTKWEDTVISDIFIYAEK